MADYDPKMIEAIARTIAGIDPGWKRYRDETALALSALPLTPEALNAIWRGEAVVVPKVRTRAMMTATPFIEDSWPAMLAASPYAKKE